MIADDEYARLRCGDLLRIDQVFARNSGYLKYVKTWQGDVVNPIKRERGCNVLLHETFLFIRRINENWCEIMTNDCKMCGIQLSFIARVE